MDYSNIALWGESVCYTYELAYPDGTVFYVGQGQGTRIDQHEQEARRGVQSEKCGIIRSIWQSGQQIIKRKIGENLTKRDAFRQEGDLIRRYGLANLTNRSIGAPQGRRKKPLVNVAVSISGELRDQVEACMLREGLEYSEASCYQFVQNICYQAVRNHVIEVK